MLLLLNLIVEQGVIGVESQQYIPLLCCRTIVIRDPGIIMERSGMREKECRGERENAGLRERERELGEREE